jgi:hypothetical protein
MVGILTAGAAGCAAGPTAAGTSTTGMSTTAVAPASTPPTAPRSTSGTTRPATPTTAPAADIRKIDFANMTYPADMCVLGGYLDPPAGGFPVRDGGFVGPDGWSVNVHRDGVLYGDLTADGREDAVVSVNCGGAVGSSNRIIPWVYASDPTAPGSIRRLPFTALPDSALALTGIPDAYTRIATPTVADGVLTIDWVVEDQPFEPTKTVTTHQRWDGTAWQTASPTTVRDPAPAG